MAFSSLGNCRMGGARDLGAPIPTTSQFPTYIMTLTYVPILNCSVSQKELELDLITDRLHKVTQRSALEKLVSCKFIWTTPSHRHIGIEKEIGPPETFPI